MSDESMRPSRRQFLGTAAAAALAAAAAPLIGRGSVALASGITTRTTAGAAATNGSTSKTSLSVTLPTVQQGDVLYLVVSGSSTDTFSKSGTGTLTTLQGPNTITSGSLTVWGYLLRYVCGASDTGKTITATGASISGRSIACSPGYVGLDSTTPEDATAKITTTSAPLVTRQITTAHDGCWCVQLATSVTNSGSTYSSHPGTQRADAGGTGSLANVSDSNASVGPTGTVTGGGSFGISASAHASVGYTVTLNPASGGGGGGTNPFKYVSSQATLTNQSSHAFAVTKATAAGDSLAVLAMTNGTAQFPTSVTDSQGNIYTLKGSYNAASPSSALFVSQGSSGGPAGAATKALATTDTVTVNLNAASSLTLSIEAVDAPGVGYLDQAVAPVHATSGTSATASVTPVNNNETLIGFIAINAAASTAPVFASPATDLVAQGTGPWEDSGYQVLTGGGGTAQSLKATWTGSAASTIYGLSFSPTAVGGGGGSGLFVGAVFQQINNNCPNGGWTGFQETSSLQSPHTDFPGGGSPQTQQSLPCNVEEFTDYFQAGNPWPPVVGFMSPPWITGPSQSGVSGCIASLYFGTGVGTQGDNDSHGLPFNSTAIRNPSSLASLPVPAGTWSGAPKMPDGSAAIPAVPLIAWHLGSTPLTDIANGVHDTDTIIPVAQQCKAWPASNPGNPAFSGQPGGQVLIRFMHEANGTWCEYNPSVLGETTTDFVNAWQHVVQVFAAQGATNVRWVWCMNIAGSAAGTVGPTPWNNGSGTCKLMYPGDNYVDYVALDGYNKFTPNWTKFHDVFATSYNWIYTGDQFTNGPITTTKPMIITEMSSYEDDMFTSPPQTKAQYIGDIASVCAASFPNIAGVMWWHAGTDALEWFTTSTPAASSAWNTLTAAQTSRLPVIQGVTSTH